MLNMVEANTEIIKEYMDYLNIKEFPCIAAKAALAKHQLKCMVADNMACPKDDEQIIEFLYSFVNECRNSKDFYHSAAIIFKQAINNTEEMFDTLLWKRLQSLADIDAQNHGYDKRVNSDPTSPEFSFSINEEAFYIIGLHPFSSRQSRRFKYPTLVFNPHNQFEQLRKSAKYEAMKEVVRKRDIILSGSVNPMLQDFGNVSEVFQYSGRMYDDAWQCPLKINHG
jgi:FPC/CPF motif-containing protein YcgG